MCSVQNRIECCRDFKSLGSHPDSIPTKKELSDEIFPELNLLEMLEISLEASRCAMGVGLRREADLIGSCQRIPDPFIASNSETFRAVDHGHTKGLGFSGWLDKLVKQSGPGSNPVMATGKACEGFQMLDSKQQGWAN